MAVRRCGLPSVCSSRWQRPNNSPNYGTMEESFVLGRWDGCIIAGLWLSRFELPNHPQFPSNIHAQIAPLLFTLSILRLIIYRFASLFSLLVAFFYVCVAICPYYTPWPAPTFSLRMAFSYYLNSFPSRRQTSRTERHSVPVSASSPSATTLLSSPLSPNTPLQQYALPLLRPIAPRPSTDTTASPPLPSTSSVFQSMETPRANLSATSVPPSPRPQTRFAAASSTVRPFRADYNRPASVSSVPSTRRSCLPTSFPLSTQSALESHTISSTPVDWKIIILKLDSYSN
jgi:hypothetical protein